ncbi:MAG TPA: S8 family serine peptidase, partial [Flavisolibacter sp.]|nr:S8 family serine peptidase [Flavisolibacter sp.]
LRNSTIIPAENIRQGYIDTLNARLARSNNKGLVLIQFNKLPTENQHKELLSNGVELLEFLSGNAYTATINGNINSSALSRVKARSVIEIAPELKMSAALAKGQIASWAVKAAGTIDVWVSFPGSFSISEVLPALKARNIEVLSLTNQSYRIISLRIAVDRLRELASLPFIDYVQAAPAGDQPLNYNDRTASRANVLNAAITDGGRGLNGEGIVVGIGDNADIQSHTDFSGRLINRAAVPAAAHGIHVSGIFAGAGIINELYRGYAPKVTIVSQAFSGILSNADTYIKDYGMVITNNSYGDIIECDYNGTYDLTSRILDQMAITYPNLENVFASGNSGASSCFPYTTGYRTVLGGYQSAKNVLTVGATNDSGAIASFSSRGPVRDGRTKPDIVAMGQRVISTWANNIYSSSNGTSMAAPGASGSLALLYQRYRQLNSGVDPKNGLMKALLCNGAMDRGNAGPDYQYGFGCINVLRSIEMLEAGHYIIGNSTIGTTDVHTISVPANTAQLKVMLYWNDPAASVMSRQTLVNDLDLQVIDATTATRLPKLLDSTVANVGNVATDGADHINNMEQVVIQNPAAGNYTVKVIPTAITQNPSQEYFLVYDPIPVQLKLTSPAGGQGLVPGEATKISWEAYGYSSGTVTLEFSADNGTSWNTIASGLDINRIFYTWTVPNMPTSNGVIRITKDGSGESSTTNSFVIMALPVVSLAPVQCEGYINLSWTAAGGATEYEVMKLQGDEMKSVAFTNATTYSFNGLSKDSIYWVTVRPLINGKAGRRAVAISRKPDSGTCSGSISDKDLKLDAIVSPVTGRKFTASALTTNTPVTIRIKNLDDSPQTGFDVKYSINGGPWVSESIAATVNGNSTYTYTFSTTADLSSPGSYTIVSVVKNSVGDPVSKNDTAIAIVKQLDNQPIDLGQTFTDDLESTSPKEYLDTTYGFDGADRYDFIPGTTVGRARTNFNSGIAFSGSKAVTIDADKAYTPGSKNYWIGTFNLGAYDTLSSDVRLDFEYLNHDQFLSSDNGVWVRGSENDPWISAYSLDDQNVAGQYVKTSSIELSDLLSSAGQNFSKSSQVRWGQFGQLPATDRMFANGFTFDDIRLYKVFNDMQMKSIDAPFSSSCGLTNATSVKVSVRNSSTKAVLNVPVRYRINGGPWVTEVIPSIGAKETLQYTFKGTADFSAFQSYSIMAIVDLDNDSFKDNDTATYLVRNTPVISTFPYLQNFESSDGNWYAGGTNSSWEYGTPISTKINRAASGAKAWKTRLLGNYNDNEVSYLYSPCMDVTGMSNPTLSFSVAMDIEDCGATICDAAWVEYSVDGDSWYKLGTTGNTTNWYNQATVQLWSTQTAYKWHVATAPLPTGANRLRLRFVMNSDPGVTREGLAIDDIHIYDNTSGIYDSVTLAAPIVSPVSGSNWIDFKAGGKLIASVLPSGQDLGNTAAQVFISAGKARNYNNQYYHNRNITIKPANRTLNDSATVRFYFLDSETDSLINANGCSTCVAPYSAYDLGVSAYSDKDTSFENGSIADDQQGNWSFIPANKLVLVPFDKGYYAEFKVKGFSEFWLNNGGFDKTSPLPVKMMDFLIQKGNGNDVLLTWKVGSESDVSKYVIEVARGEAQMQAGQFEPIGTVESLGNTFQQRTYNFNDNEQGKAGVQYYRIKIVNADGSYFYSSVKSILFDQSVLWRVYPNPSKGIFQLIYQVNAGELFVASVYDSRGRLVYTNNVTGTGYIQKFSLDLTSPAFAKGIYLLSVKWNDKYQT